MIEPGFLVHYSRKGHFQTETVFFFYNLSLDTMTASVLVGWHRFPGRERGREKKESVLILLGLLTVYVYRLCMLVTEALFTLAHSYGCNPRCCSGLSAFVPAALKENE